MAIALPNYNEVTTTVPERIPLSLRELLLKTLVCPGCRMVFRSPISTCTVGHSTCYTCSTRLNRCAVCAAPLGSLRNYTIESQLGLVDVECGIPLCTKRISVANLYDHFAKCEFRTIHCRLPITQTSTHSGGARIDCAAVSRFEDYTYHLTQIHGAKRYQLLDPNGYYDFAYNACSDDFLRCPDALSSSACPVPLILGSKQFLLHSELKQHGFSLWVSAMFAEEEAVRYKVIIQLIARQDLDLRHKFPKWEIRAHNYHENKGPGDDPVDRITMQPTLLRRYAEINGGRWAWTVLCNIDKVNAPKSEPIDIVVD